MIIKPDIKKLVDKSNCRFALVVATAQRARMLVEGQEPKVQLSYVAADKPVSAAVEEIAAEKVICGPVVE